MRSLLWACVALVAGCGVAGNRGAAVFHVGDNWGNNRPVAVGSVFAAGANRNDLVQTQLTVKSATPAVIENLDTGSLRAKTPGVATLEAADPVSQALVDTVDFEVAQPAAVALSWWVDAWVQPTFQVPSKVALALGSRQVVAVSLLDAKARPLHHKGIVSLSCDKLQVSPVGEMLEVTPTTAGSCTGTLTVNGADGKPTLTRTYEVLVVKAPQVAKVDLKAASIKVIGAKPTGTEMPPPHADEQVADQPAKGTWWLLSAQATLADGTRIYGVPVQWSEVGGKGGHLLASVSDGGNWLWLNTGEQVTVNATAGSVSASVTLGP